jgi:hypothetical protein
MDGYSLTGASPTPSPLFRVCAHISLPSACTGAWSSTPHDRTDVSNSVHSAAARHTPVPRLRLSSADCTRTLPASQLRCALYKIQARPYDQACASPVPVPVPTTHSTRDLVVHCAKRPSLPSPALHPSPSHLPLLPRLRPSPASRVPHPLLPRSPAERELCASIVRQRRADIRLMRRLPAARAASPAALVVSPPVPTPHHAMSRCRFDISSRNARGQRACDPFLPHSRPRYSDSSLPFLPSPSSSSGMLPASFDRLVPSMVPLSPHPTRRRIRRPPPHTAPPLSCPLFPFPPSFIYYSNPILPLHSCLHFARHAQICPMSEPIWRQLEF